MGDNEQMQTLVNNLWAYFEKKIDKKLGMGVRYYRAEVVENPGGNKLVVQRPFDNPVTIPCVNSMQSAEPGAQVVVLQFGNGANAANAVVVGDGSLKTFGGAELPLSVQNGGTGVTTIPEIVQTVFNNNFSAASVVVYPGTAGIYRTIGTEIFSNLAHTHSNYGILAIIRAYYAMHIYVDSSGRMFYGYSGDTFQEPTKWEAVDGIVEQGTSGIWTYRKYESGVAECWGSQRYTGSASTSWGSLYVLTCTPPTYPFTFTAKPIVTRDITQNTGTSCWLSGWSAGSTSNMGTFSLVRPTTGTVDVDVNFHVKGKWK